MAIDSGTSNRGTLEANKHDDLTNRPQPTDDSKERAADAAQTPITPGRPAGAAAQRDVRYIALRNFAVAITVLNVVGYTVLGFEQPWLWPILCVVVAYAADLALEYGTAWAQQRDASFRGNGLRGVYEFLLPAHITALAVNMLLYANNQIWPPLFGVIAGVGSKYIFRARIQGKSRHFMNPSNFGITAALLLFGSWISVAPPYQFSENVNAFFSITIVTILAIAGTVLNASLTKKIPLIVGWLGGFVIQSLVRYFITDISLISALSTMSGIAFILFTNYMISDPGTTPFAPRMQFMFGASVATMYGALMLFNIVYTLFFALTIVCAIRGVWWWSRAFLDGRRST